MNNNFENIKKVRDCLKSNLDEAKKDAKKEEKYLDLKNYDMGKVIAYELAVGLLDVVLEYWDKGEKNENQ